MPSKNHFSLASTRASSAALIFSLLLGAPISTLAAESDIEVSGWIPYWRTEAGTDDAREHLEQFTEVNPFGYSVRADGSLSDTMRLNQDAWQDLIEAAQDEDVRVVPTIMWSDTNNIHAVLSNPTKRAAHIRAIVAEVEKHDFDGIDIDYEGKKAETRVPYALFLQELSVALKKEKNPKWLQCTIEARMPLSARFSGTPPANIEYANDLPSINRSCDRVRIMTYDQQTADIELNRKYRKELYAPVADVEWVEKVVDYMGKDIDKKKMVIGIPTYGYIYQVMPYTNGSGFSYIKTEAFNPRYGTDIAEEYDLTPVRGASGELSLTYVPKDSPASLPSQKELSRQAPRGTESGLLAALGAIAYAKEERRQAPVTYLTWSDAGAIKQKVELAERMGLRGVAVFKIDGGVDADLWDALPDDAPKLAKAPKAAPGFVDPIRTPLPTTPAAPANASRPFSADLVYGDTSSDVQRLQQILITEGYLKIPATTTFFGPATLAAVRAWQEANGIPNTGNFGPLSRAEMGRGR